MVERSPAEWLVRLTLDELAPPGAQISVSGYRASDMGFLRFLPMSLDDSELVGLDGSADHRHRYHVLAKRERPSLTTLSLRSNTPSGAFSRIQLSALFVAVNVIHAIRFRRRYDVECPHNFAGWIFVVGRGLAGRQTRAYLVIR
jgi:hypothetical protein